MSKNYLLGHDLPISVNDSDFAMVLVLLNFAGAKFRENKTFAKISDFTVSFFFVLLCAILFYSHQPTGHSCH